MLLRVQSQSQSRVAAVAVSVLGLSLVVSGCSGGSQWGDEAEASQSETPDETKAASRDVSVWLWPQCGQKVESPGSDVIEVDTSGTGFDLESGVTADEDGLYFGIIFQNPTDLIAVDVDYSFRFIGDGEDVTGELGADFEKQWNGGHARVAYISPAGIKTGDSIIEKPDGWEDLDLKLEAEVTGVDYWCTYEEPGPYSG